MESLLNLATLWLALQIVGIGLALFLVMPLMLFIALIIKISWKNLWR